MNNHTVNSKRDALVQFTILLALCLLLSILLAACGSSEEEASAPVDAPVVPTTTDVPPIATPIPPTDTLVLPTDSPASPTPVAEKTTPNPIQLAMTEQAQGGANVKPTSTSAPTSCEGIDGVCLRVSFDGEDCTYDGPTEIASGQVSLLFVNDSATRASANLWKHDPGRTFQEMIDYLEQDTPPVAHPPWSNSVSGVWGLIDVGGSRVWEGVLQPAIYTVVCGSEATAGAMYGVGLTVEE